MNIPFFEIGTGLVAALVTGGMYVALNFFDARTGEARLAPTEAVDEVAPQELTDCLESLDGLPPEFQDDLRVKKRVIVVFKRQMRIGLYEDGILVTDGAERLCYPVNLGLWPYEPKVRRDYASTPEGFYRVASKHTTDPADEFPHTSFYKGLFVDYPNAADVQHALELEVIDRKTADGLLRQIARGELPSQTTPMGGAILIHGWAVQPGSATAGCVGVEDKNIDKLFERVDVHDPILILPWRRVLYTDGTFAPDTTPPPPRVIDFTMDGLEAIIDKDASAKRGITVFETITITASP